MIPAAIRRHGVVLGEALEMVAVFVVVLANLALMVYIQRWSGLT
jgi:hypothetical protein